jgi:hypothetical protein
VSRAPIAERAYTALIALYPRRFREAYRADLVDLFRDQCQDEPRWRVYLRTILDLALTVPHQHLEAHMNRNPTPALLLASTTVGFAGLGVMVLGGTNAAALVVGAVIAIAGFGLTAATWRQQSRVREPGLASQWWKFVVSGPVLIGLVIVGSGLGVEAWFVGLAVVLAAIVCVALGLVLGVVHVVGRRHPTPA